MYPKLTSRLKPKDRLGMSLNHMKYCFLQKLVMESQHLFQVFHHYQWLVFEQIHLIEFAQIIKLQS